MVTANGLLIIGATIYDRKLRIYDSANGKELWSTELPYAGTATPATYMVNGEQYIVIGASSGRDQKATAKGAALVAYKLPK